MSTRELVFKYTTKGAKAARRADEQVRSSVKETGATANRQAGRVERWMTANKQAIQGLAVASLAAVGSILSASPTMRAELSGVRAAFTLLSDTIVRDVLPGTGSLAQKSLELAQAYRELDSSIRRPISRLAAFAAAVVILLPVVATLVKSISVLHGAWVALAGSGAIATVVAGIKAAVVAIAGFLGISVGWIAVLIGLIALAGAFAVAYITNFKGVRDKTNAFVGNIIDYFGNLWQAIKDRVNQIRSRLSNGFADAKKGVVDRVKDIVSAVKSRFTSLKNDAIEWGSGIIDNLVSGIKDKIGRSKTATNDIVSAVKSRFTSLKNDATSWGEDIINNLVKGMRNNIGKVENAAKDVARKIREYLPSSPAERGPLRDLDKVQEAIPNALQGGLDSGIDGVTGSIDPPQSGTTNSGGGISVGEITIAIQGSGNYREDGRSAAREVANEFERQLGSRGA